MYIFDEYFLIFRIRHFVTAFNIFVVVICKICKCVWDVIKMQVRASAIMFATHRVKINSAQQPSILLLKKNQIIIVMNVDDNNNKKKESIE